MSDRKPQIKVTLRTTPTYCTVCDAPQAIHVRLDNPKVGAPLTLALCDSHADSLGQRLTNIVRRRRYLRQINPSGAP